MTLRDLVQMVRGRQQHDWSIASTYLAMLANVNRDPKKGKTYKPADFDPTIERKRGMSKAELKKFAKSVNEEIRRDAQRQ